MIFFVFFLIGVFFHDSLIYFLERLFFSIVVDKSYLLKVTIFIMTYSLSILFLIPLGLVLMPLSGYLFGMVQGFIICNFSVALGLMVIYIIVKKNFSEFLTKKINKNLPKIKNILSENNISSLFLIRLTGIIPFSIQNILSASIATKKIPYLFIPLFVMSPWVIVWNYLGSSLEYYSLLDDLNILDLIKKEYYVILVLLFYLIIFFFVIKNIKKKLI